MTQIQNDRQPVIVGVADVIDRPATPDQGRHPLQLLVDAIRAADADGAGGWLDQVGRVDIVNMMSWPYLDLEAQLGSALGWGAETRIVHGPVGGESPLRYLQDAARAIADGQLETAIVCGAESLSTVMKAGMAGVTLKWPARDPAFRFTKAEDLSPLEVVKYGLRSPVDMYPLYENATRSAWGQDFEAGQAESATIWSQFSEVAAKSPYAWLPKTVDPATIRSFGEKNRPIAWPYCKLMIANNSVNMGAAIIITSYGAAKAAGLADEHLSFVWDGCAAAEPRNIAARDSYTHSTAQDTVLSQTLSRNGLQAADLDLVELYSCFPCVPKMARRTLGFDLDRGPFTVAGGLTFFGAPLNAYMVHATTAMARRLRSGTEKLGLLYGQGEFVTKHHALIISAMPPPTGVQTGEPSVQAQADAARLPVPAFRDGYVGAGTVETYTVWFDRNGVPEKGVVVARNAAGERFLARIPKGNQALLAQFTNPQWDPVGSQGQTQQALDGLVDWTPAA